MRRPFVLLLVALATIADAMPASTADADITVKDIGNSEFELTLNTSTTINIFDAQLELTPTAKKTCGAKEVHFGHYAFGIQTPLKGTAPDKPTSMTLTQTIRCGAATPPTIPQSTSAPDDWKPSLKDQSQVESQTYRYFEAKDAGDYKAAYAMFADAIYSPYRDFRR